MSTLTINLNNVQETLVSGTNIKTINGTSVLGSGNIQIDPLSVGTSGQIPFVNGTNDDLAYGNLSWDGALHLAEGLSLVPNGTNQLSFYLNQSGTTEIFKMSSYGTSDGQLFGRQYSAGGTAASRPLYSFIEQTQSGVYLHYTAGTRTTLGLSANTYAALAVQNDNSVPKVAVGEIVNGFGTVNSIPATFTVYGSGSTSATTNLLLQNASGTELLKVTDDGAATLNGTIFINGGSLSNLIEGLFGGNRDWVQFGTPSSKFKFTNVGNILSLRTTGQQFRIQPISGGANVFRVLSYYAGGVPITIQGATSQTGNLTEWWNSSGTKLSVVSADGSFGIGTSSPSANLSVDGTVNFTNLPTSATGLSAGDLWVDSGGHLRIV